MKMTRETQTELENVFILGKSSDITVQPTFTLYDGHTKITILFFLNICKNPYRESVYPQTAHAFSIEK